MKRPRLDNVVILLFMLGLGVFLGAYIQDKTTVILPSENSKACSAIYPSPCDDDRKKARMPIVREV